MELASLILWASWLLAVEGSNLMYQNLTWPSPTVTKYELSVANEIDLTLEANLCVANRRLRRQSHMFRVRSCWEPIETRISLLLEKDMHESSMLCPTNEASTKGDDGVRFHIVMVTLGPQSAVAKYAPSLVTANVVMVCFDLEIRYC